MLFERDNLHQGGEVALVLGEGILPVNVDPVEAVLPRVGDGVGDECLSVSSRGCHRLELGSSKVVASERVERLQSGVGVFQGVDPRVETDTGSLDWDVVPFDVSKAVVSPIQRVTYVNE